MTMENDRASLFIELRPGMRKALADAVEAFVALLDQIDADADLEEDNAPEDDAPCEEVGDDEPSLGSLGGSWNGERFDQSTWSHGADDDREDESELLEEGGDEEPTLGATTAMNQECAWQTKTDRWTNCDEDEPSLGWTGHGRGHPEIAMRGYGDDREATTGPRDEEGEADQDGWECPAHLPGGNGEWLPGGYPVPATEATPMTDPSDCRKG